MFCLTSFQDDLPVFWSIDTIWHVNDNAFISTLEYKTNCFVEDMQIYDIEKYETASNLKIIEITELIANECYTLYSFHDVNFIVSKYDLRLHNTA